MTVTSRPNRSSIACSNGFASRDRATRLVKSTFPLWMNVFTSPCPSDATTSASSAIGSLRAPPTLIPRKNAT